MRLILVVSAATLLLSSAIAYAQDFGNAAPPTDQQWSLISPTLPGTERADVLVEPIRLHKGDQSDDDLIVIRKGSNWCGSGGCSVGVAAYEGDRYRLVSDWLGVRVTPLDTYYRGMRNLKIDNAGYSIWNATRGEYPQPATTQQMEEFEQYFYWLLKLLDAHLTFTDEVAGLLQNARDTQSISEAARDKLHGTIQFHRMYCGVKSPPDSPHLANDVKRKMIDAASTLAEACATMEKINIEAYENSNAANARAANMTQAKAFVLTYQGQAEELLKVDLAKNEVLKLMDEAAQMNGGDTDTQAWTKKAFGSP